MDEQGWESAAIIGHSLGGAIGLSTTSFHPDRVDKLVLLDIGFARIERFPVSMFGTTGYFLPIISGLHRLSGPRFLGQDGGKIEFQCKNRRRNGITDLKPRTHR